MKTPRGNCEMCSKKNVPIWTDGHGQNSLCYRCYHKTRMMASGKKSTKVEISKQEPTCNLRWHKGVLQQLCEITERHRHYSGDHYNHSTYHKREKWKAVDGAPNKQREPLAPAKEYP